jgi:hypothetical protein
VSSQGQPENLRGSRLGDALIVAANAEPDVVSRTKERGVYAALGVSVLAVGAIAAVTSVAALATATKIPWWALVPVGMFWGSVLFAFDRGVILGGPRYGDLDAGDTGRPSRRHRASPYIGRVLVSVFVGIVVADVACLALFEPDINAQLATTNQTRFNEVLDAQAQAQKNQVALYETAVTEREEALTQLEAEYAAAQKDADQEANGTGGTGKAGRGEVWRRKQAHADKVRADRDAAVTALATAKSDRDKAVAAASAETDERNANNDSKPSDVLKATGILSRHEAMVTFLKNEPGALLMFLIITLVLLAVDLLPVVGKLMTSNSVYERERREGAHDLAHRLTFDRWIKRREDDQLARDNSKIRQKERAAAVDAADAEHDVIRHQRELRLKLELERSEMEHLLARKSHSMDAEFRVTQLERRHAARMQTLNQPAPPTAARPATARSTPSGPFTSTQSGGGGPPAGATTVPIVSNLTPTIVDDRPNGAAPGPAVLPDPVGPNGRYQPVQPLDQGAQASTWYGFDTETSREVAIKLVPVDGSNGSGPIGWMRKALLRPKVVLQEGPRGGPEYPYIGEIITMGVTDGVYYQISPYYGGGSLGAFLRSPAGGSVRLDQMLRMLEDILLGLNSAAEWFHGDIKPDNLVFDGDRLRVIDWGVSKLRSRLGDGQTSMPPGSFAYMSPEQTRAWFLRAEILGGRSRPRLALMDLYSVGSVAMHIATGEPAYALEKITYEGQGWWEGTLPPPRIDAFVPGTPPSVVALIMGWVELDPARRGGGPTEDVIGAALEQLRRTRAAMTPVEARFVIGRDRVISRYPAVTTQPVPRQSPGSDELSPDGSPDPG